MSGAYSRGLSQSHSSELPTEMSTEMPPSSELHESGQNVDRSPAERDGPANGIKTCGPSTDGDTLAGQNCCGRWFLVGSTWFVRQAPDLFGGIDLFFENPLFFYVGSIFVLGLIE